MASSKEAILKSQITATKKTISSLKRKIRSWRKEGFKSKYDAQAQYQLEIDDLNVLMQNVKGDLRELRKGKRLAKERAERLKKESGRIKEKAKKFMDEQKRARGVERKRLKNLGVMKRREAERIAKVKRQAERNEKARLAREKIIRAQEEKARREIEKARIKAEKIRAKGRREAKLKHEVRYQKQVRAAEREEAKIRKREEDRIKAFEEEKKREDYWAKVERKRLERVIKQQKERDHEDALLYERIRKKAAAKKARIEKQLRVGRKRFEDIKPRKPVRVTRVPPPVRVPVRPVTRIPTPARARPSLASVMRRTRKRLRLGERRRGKIDRAEKKAYAEEARRRGKIDRAEKKAYAEEARRARRPTKQAVTVPPSGAPAAAPSKKDYTGEAEARARAEQEYRTGKFGIFSARTSFWIKKVIKIIFYIFIIVLVLYAILGSIVGKSITGKLGPGVESIFTKAKSFVSLKMQELKSEVTGVGKWENPYVTDVQEKRGVEITEVIPYGKSIFSVGEEISIFGKGKIKALGESVDVTDVEFGCYMGDSGLYLLDETKQGEPNRDVVFAVPCGVGKAESAGVKTVRFVALYRDFETEAKLGLWTFGRDVKSAGIDPLDMEENKKIVELYRKSSESKHLWLDDDRTTKSSSNFAPVRIAMHVVNTQPLAKGEYILEVKTTLDVISFDGNLTKGILVFDVPENIIELEEKCRYDQELKNNEYYHCKFKLSNIREDLSFVTIKAKAVYDYEFSRKSTVTVT